MIETAVNIVGGLGFGLLIGSLGIAYCNRWHEKRYKKLGWKLDTATWKLKDYQELAVLDETKGMKCSKCRRYLSMDWCLGWERTPDGGLESTCPYECQP